MKKNIFFLLIPLMLLCSCEHNKEVHVYGELIPEVPATCENQGMKAHYFCSHCKKYFDSEKYETNLEDLIIEKIPHSFNDSYSYDNDYHYHVCSNSCGTSTIKEKHTALDTYYFDDNQHWQQCVCGYKMNIESHKASDDSVYTSESINYHYHVCKCGQIVDKGEHVYDQLALEEKFIDESKCSCGDEIVCFKSCKCGAKGVETFIIPGSSLPHKVESLYKNEHCHENVCVRSGCDFSEIVPHHLVNTSCPTNLISYKVGICDECGNKGSIPMENEDVVFSNETLYGVETYTSSGELSNKVVYSKSYDNTGLPMIYFNNDMVDSSGMIFGFPKVNYRIFDNVKFNLYFNGGDSKLDVFGFSPSNSGSITLKHDTTLEISKNILNKYSAKIIIKTNGEDIVKVLNDISDNVLAGKECFKVYLQLPKYHNICIKSIELSSTPTSLNDHSVSGDVVPKDKIGFKTGVCDLCGEDVNQVMRTNDIMFGQDALYGAESYSEHVYDKVVYASNYDNTGLPMIYFNNQYESEGVLFGLPKTNFNIFDAVKFELYFNNVTGNEIGFSSDKKTTMTSTFGSYIEFRKQNEKVVASMVVKGEGSNDITLTEEITNEKVLFGEECLKLYLKLPKYHTIAIHSIILNDEEKQQHEEHIIVEEKVPTTYIGNKECICQICGPVVLPMESSDIDFSKGIYGAESYDPIGAFKVGYDSNCDSMPLLYLHNEVGGEGFVFGLPKVNFLKFNSVKFNLYFNGGNSWADKMGTSLEDAMTISMKTGNYIEFVNDGDKITVNIVCAAEAGNKTISSVVTDTDVINGKKCFTPYLKLPKWHNIGIKDIELN